MLTISQNPYYYNYNYNFNVKFKGLSAVDICSQLCKGHCCNHSTVLSMPLKIATDRLMGEYLKASSVESRNILPLKRIVYSWGLGIQNPEALNINNEINKLLEKAQNSSSKEKIDSIMQKVNELNAKLETIVGNKEEVFIPITNRIFKDEPAQAVISNLPNICMYKDPETNKCTIYYGLNTPEGKTISRPNPCLDVGSEKQPCPWLNPEKVRETINASRSLLASKGYVAPDEAIVRYVFDQYNLNDTWREKIYKPYLDSQGIKY